MSAASPKSVRISNKFLAAEAEQGSNAGATLTCKECNKRVYEMEKIIADNTVYHKTCFKCSHCKRVLSLGNYTAAGGNKQLYCKPHFIELFRTKGNYEEGFGMEKKTRPPGSDTFEGLQPNAGSSAAKAKTPSKWEKSAGDTEVVNRRVDDLDGGSDLPRPSTTKDMMARYTNAASGESGASKAPQEGMHTSELPEQGTTRALLAKFKEIQTGNGNGNKSPGTKQPVKLVDDEVPDYSRSPSVHSPGVTRTTPEGSLSPQFDPHQDRPSPQVTSPRANGSGAPALHSGSSYSASQYDNNDDDDDTHAASSHGDAGLLVAVKKEEHREISDEDEVERDIEGHGHHYEGHHEGHHDLGQGHHDLGQGHHDEGHGYDEGQGYEDEGHHEGHYQGHVQEEEYDDGGHHQQHHDDNEHHGDYHQQHQGADEGQLIDFGGDEEVGQRQSLSGSGHRESQGQEGSEEEDDYEVGAGEKTRASRTYED